VYIYLYKCYIWHCYYFTCICANVPSSFHLVLYSLAHPFSHKFIQLCNVIEYKYVDVVVVNNGIPFDNFEYNNLLFEVICNGLMEVMNLVVYEISGSISHTRNSPSQVIV
jgi:hypothetical protein